MPLRRTLTICSSTLALIAGFAVVIVGTSLAGILGAVFAIPTAAAILAIANYLRERDVLLRTEPAEVQGDDTAPGGQVEGGPVVEATS